MNHEDDDLRALYAGLAMMGLLAGRVPTITGIIDPEEVARNSMKLADALLKELQRSDSNAGEGRR